MKASAAEMAIYRYFMDRAQAIRERIIEAKNDPEWKRQVEDGEAEWLVYTIAEDWEGTYQLRTILNEFDLVWAREENEQYHLVPSEEAEKRGMQTLNLYPESVFHLGEGDDDLPIEVIVEEQNWAWDEIETAAGNAAIRLTQEFKDVLGDDVVIFIGSPSHSNDWGLGIYYCEW